MLYSYMCSDCDSVKDEFRSVDRRHEPVRCDCGTLMQKLLGGHRVIGDMQPYYDDNLQTYVKTRSHRQQVMREQGVSEAYGRNWHTGANTKKRGPRRQH